MIEVKEITLEDDIALIVNSIENASWSKNSEIDLESYSIENLKKCLENKHHIFCIALLDRDFSGMASAFLLHKLHGDVMLYIDEVDVCSNKQQKGVGTALMQFLFEYGRKKRMQRDMAGDRKRQSRHKRSVYVTKPCQGRRFCGISIPLNL